MIAQKALEGKMHWRRDKEPNVKTPQLRRFAFTNSGDCGIIELTFLDGDRWLISFTYTCTAISHCSTGWARSSDLAQEAAAMGMPALALTDHGVMFGALHFYHAAKYAGINPIMGCEIYVSPRACMQKEAKRDTRPTHLVLLAENQAGYQNLLKIATAAQLEGFYYKPRVDKAFLAEHAEGLIALSSCASGEVARLAAEQPPPTGAKGSRMVPGGLWP